MKNFDELIERIARKHETTPKDVSFEMEKAIEHMWEGDSLRKHFKNKPTIQEFLTFAVKEISKPK